MARHNKVAKRQKRFDSTTVTVVLQDAARNALLAYGNTVPSDSGSGYATGCLFQHTDGTDKTAVYVNEGTETSCDFNAALVQTPAVAMTAALTALTHSAPGTPDYAIQNLTNSSPFGFVTADEGNTVLSVIVRTAVRVAELQAACEAAGIVAPA